GEGSVELRDNCLVAGNGAADKLRPGIDVQTGGHVDATGCKILENGLGGVRIGEPLEEDRDPSVSARQAEGVLTGCDVSGNHRTALEVGLGGTVTATGNRLLGSPRSVWTHPGAGGTLQECTLDVPLDR